MKLFCRNPEINPIRDVSVYVLMLLMSLFFSSSSRSAEADCDGALRWIQGHLYLANGTPSVRLHDTKFGGTYGVLLEKDPGHPETPIYPERPILPPDLRNLLSWDAKIHGNFLFCIVHVQEYHFDLGFVIKWDRSVDKRDDG